MNFVPYATRFYKVGNFRACRSKFKLALITYNWLFAVPTYTEFESGNLGFSTSYVSRLVEAVLCVVKFFVPYATN